MKDIRTQFMVFWAVLCIVFVSILYSVNSLHPQGGRSVIKITKKEQLNKLKEKIRIDSITINQMEKDYVELWEENQIFSSMLSEIENEPGGSDIINKLWNINK
tara:strand:+ start:581 stop:889 length:309 start_codon:yes stop_codon:yes gene_type:complete